MGGTLLSSMLALAVVASPGPANADRSAAVGGTLSGIVTADDYPADALDLNQEGSVGVLVRIDTKGAVSDCVVTSSSGSPALDAQTCRLVWLRAKFTPARGRTGTPVASSYEQRIAWQIGNDDDGATSEPWMVRWVVNGWNYALPSCRSGIGEALESATPAECPSYIAGIAASLPDSLKVHSDLVIEQRFTVGDAPNIMIASSDRLIGKELARLEIDAHGKVSSCKVIETVGLMPPQLSRSCLITAKQYTPRKDGSGSPVAFAAYFIIGVYAHTHT
jgi:TonB family protein